jgi:Tfp pilus assembly protein PilF
VASYEDALSVVATPMNQLAWHYLQQGDTERALPLSRLAVQLCPKRAVFLATLAEVLTKQGEREEAVVWMKKAVALDEKYRNELSQLQHAAKP